MFKQTFTVKNPTGLHARPASQLVHLCKNFTEEIYIIVGTNKVNPKSIISILSAGIKSGTPLTIQVTGKNEDAVGKQLINFLDNLAE